MRFLRKLLSWLLWPLRVFGLASDAYQLWSLGEWLLSVGGSAVITGTAWIATFIAPLPRPAVYLIAAGAFLLAFWTLIVVAEKRRVRREASARQPESQAPNAGATNIERIQTAYFGAAATPEASRPAVSIPLDERRQLTRKWRTEIENGDFTRTPHGHSQFCTTETYVDMEPYLQRRVKDRMRSHAGAAVAWVGSPHLRGTEGDRRAMKGELARIEEEWGTF